MCTNFPVFMFAASVAFSSMVQPLSLPDLMVDEMDGAFQACAYSPAKIYNHITREDEFSLVCRTPKPVLNSGKPQQNELDFYFVRYLCMELYDLTLQLCEHSTSSNQIAEEKRIAALQLDVANLCKNLRFSESRADKTQAWADIAVNYLKNETFCKKKCLSESSRNSICVAIYVASELLIDINDKKPVAPASPVSSSNQKVPTDTEQEKKVQTGPNDDNSTNLKDVLMSKVGESNISTESKQSSPEKSDVKNGAKVISAMNNPPPKYEESANSSLTSRGSEKIASVLPSSDSITNTVAITVGTETLEKVGNKHDDFSMARVEENMDSQENILLGNTPDKDGVNDPPKEDVEEGTFGDENKPPGGEENAFSSTGNSVGGAYVNKIYPDAFVDAQDSHFFAYFLTMLVVCIVGYLVFHNKQKIIALALEGRRMQGSRRRPNTKSYKKLDSNLEEAVTSTCSSSSVTQVIF